MNPKILVLDEPTSNLDFAWRSCDRSVILSGGKIVADAPTRELLVDRELLEAHGLELPLSAELERLRG